MIIVENEEKCNKEMKFNIEKYQRYYNKLVKTAISSGSIECPDCHSHDWSIHAYYKRSVDIFKRSHKITITRIKCNECGKTHAILIEDMVPYSIVDYDLIVHVCLRLQSITASHDLFIRNKYGGITEFNYKSIVKESFRKNTCIFINLST